MVIKDHFVKSADVGLKFLLLNNLNNLNNFRNKQNWLYHCKTQLLPWSSRFHKIQEWWLILGDRIFFTHFAKFFSLHISHYLKYLYYIRHSQGRVWSPRLCRKTFGVSFESSWHQDEGLMDVGPDFRPWSAWEAPTGSWRTWARTSPGLIFGKSCLTESCQGWSTGLVKGLSGHPGPSGPSTGP